MNALINRANQARKQTIRTIENEVRAWVYGGSSAQFTLSTATLRELQSELQTVALRPTSLGFQESDIRYFIEGSGTDKGFIGYARLVEGKAEPWKKLNAVIHKMDHPTKDLVGKRDAAYKRLQVVSTMLKVLTDELSRREGIRLAEQREYEQHRAEIEAREAEQRAAVEAALKAAKNVKLKPPRQKLHTGPAPKREDGFKKVIKSSEASNPFEALKGEVLERQRQDWQHRPIKKAEAVQLVGDEQTLISALRFAQKMGTDEVMDVNDGEGVIRYKPHGNSVRYEYYGV